ncbi:hypothetical protein Z955_13400, partial [Clostridium botulinum C/D str. DC5]
IKLANNYINTNITNISLEETEVLIKDLISIEKDFKFDVFKERVDAIKNYSGKINNIVGMLRVAIRERWSYKIHINNNFMNDKKDSFNNYKQRDYDFKKLEKVMLGQSNDSLEDCIKREVSCENDDNDNMNYSTLDLVKQSGLI